MQSFKSHCTSLVLLLAACVGCDTSDTTPQPRSTAPPLDVAKKEQADPISEDTNGATSSEISATHLHRLLKKKNPRYRSDAKFHKSGGKILMADFFERKISDISPLKGLVLEVVDLGHTKINDITALQGMPLKNLNLEGTPISDITPIEGSSIELLNLIETKVKDISPIASLESIKIVWLRKAPVEDISPFAKTTITSIDIQDTPVSDLSSLSKMTSLQRLNIVGTKVTDLSPLKDLKLTRLLFTPMNIKKGLDTIRQMKSLTELDIAMKDQRRLSPNEFWIRYDAGEFQDK